MYQNFPEEITSDSMGYVYAQPLEGPYGDCTYGGATYTTLVGFSADFIADEDRFARFLEIAQDLGGYNDPETYICARYGERGVHWDYDENGTPISFPGYETVAERVAIGGLITFQFAMSDVTNTCLSTPTGRRPLEYIQENLNYVTSPIYVTAALPSAADYQAELDKLADETFVDIITGAQPIEAFDEMVETWYSIGGEQLTEEANDLYNPNNA